MRGALALEPTYASLRQRPKADKSLLNIRKRSVFAESLSPVFTLLLITNSKRAARFYEHWPSNYHHHPYAAATCTRPRLNASIREYSDWRTWLRFTVELQLPRYSGLESSVNSSISSCFALFDQEAHKPRASCAAATVGSVNSLDPS